MIADFPFALYLLTKLGERARAARLCGCAVEIYPRDKSQCVTGAAATSLTKNLYKVERAFANNIVRSHDSNGLFIHAGGNTKPLNQSEKDSAFSMENLAGFVPGGRGFPLERPDDA